MFDKAYNPGKYEADLYKKWEESGLFAPSEATNDGGASSDGKSKKPFVISMPPPNATGTLHLGHAIFLTLNCTGEQCD